MICCSYQACSYIFVEPTNWRFQQFLRSIGVHRRRPTLADRAGEQSERVVRWKLSTRLTLSARRIIRYADSYDLLFREADALCVDVEGITIWECKLTDSRWSAQEGMDQLRSLVPILRANGFTGRIRLRIVIVSNRANITTGLPPETDLFDTKVDEAIPRSGCTLR